MVEDIKSLLRDKPLWQKAIIIFMWPFTLSYIISKRQWSFGKKAVIIGGMWVFLLVFAYMDEIKAPPAQPQETTQQVQEETQPTQQPTLSFAEQPLTQESVKAEMLRLMVV